VNFMELIGASMGFARPDVFKRLKMLQDVDAVIADTQDLIDAYASISRRSARSSSRTCSRSSPCRCAADLFLPLPG